MTSDLLIVLIAVAVFGYALSRLWSSGRRGAHMDAEHVRKSESPPDRSPTP